MSLIKKSDDVGTIKKYTSKIIITLYPIGFPSEIMGKLSLCVAYEHKKKGLSFENLQTFIYFFKTHFVWSLLVILYVNCENSLGLGEFMYIIY